ncbi:hypothetical protein [Phytohabitans maris]|uniref:hypothetical protein n=1 Tax=Phytohabitans maris TaxID=3071409 RepID=UPI00280BC07E|nr:hypothetical protein [Phytohabitans sp. ZYX-F-186]
MPVHAGRARVMLAELGELVMAADAELIAGVPVDDLAGELVDAGLSGRLVDALSDETVRLAAAELRGRALAGA